MNCLELFAGAGGLALGGSAAGFDHDGVIEFNSDACNTIRANQRAGIEPALHWPLIQADVHSVDFSKWAGIDLITGGPPCQPFSIGGKHRGLSDRRNLFPQAVRAVREIRPKAFIFENVKGLLREAFTDYYEYIILQLTYPGLEMRRGESWLDHQNRLEQHHTSGASDKGLHYRVVFRLLNAADYGVPQRRERVFIVGFRCDIREAWSFPDPTHSAAALARAKHLGTYWENHRVPRALRMEAASREVDSFDALMLKPWRTVRDALAGLPEPRESQASGFQNHVLQRGARSYPGHTGSPLDEPAKTLKAGDHGVPGGENMVRYSDETVRYFTVRESARLQTFPDNYIFGSSWTENMRQLGNAVPVQLAEAVARSVSASLKRSSLRNT
jgi:DNA (cytosine-5)-methyltransferase 1